MNATRTGSIPPTKAHGRRCFKYTPTECGCGVLEIEGKKNSDHYMVMEFPAHEDFDGRAFCLTKADGTRYDLLLSNRHPAWDSCDCAGYVFGQFCKHNTVLREILRCGWFTPEPIIEPEDPWEATEADSWPLELRFPSWFTDSELDEMPDCMAVEQRILANQTVRNLIHAA